MMLKEWGGGGGGGGGGYGIKQVAIYLRGGGVGWGMESHNYKCSVTGLPNAVMQRYLPNQLHVGSNNII